MIKNSKFSRWLTLALLSGACALGACSDSSSSEPASSNNDADDVSSDSSDSSSSPDTALADTASLEDDAENPDDVPEDAPEDSGDASEPAREFEARLPSTEELGVRRGFRVVRGIIHSHSIHSHDACDGKPRLEDGSYNEPCNLDWRHGICSTRQDFILSTDHEGLAAFTDFEELLLLRDGDTAVMDAQGRPVANRMSCPDADARPLILPGGEFGVMPVGLSAHLEAESAEALDQMYTEVTPERIASYKELGAVVLQAHTESRTVDQLRPLGLDGFEIYNLHANIAPNIREEWLGLEPFGYADDIAPFIEFGGPEPDLAFLAFFTANLPSLLSFDTLLAEGHHLVGVAGTDSHQNSLPFPLSDGERGDSFRRMMRFFSNHLLVPETVTPDAIKDALRSGRAYIAFETLGTPLGFDYRAEIDDGDVVEMGDGVALSAAPMLRVSAPTAFGEEVTGPVTVKILRAQEGGAVEVASSNGDLDFSPAEPGAYRVEITVIPTHLKPFLTETNLHEREYVWIYGNPIYVR